MTTTQEPRILLDEPEDGICEEHGWVEATVSEDTARDLIAPFMYCADTDTPVRPTSKATRVWMKPTHTSPYPDEDRWLKCYASDLEAREFWQFDATETEPA